MDKEAIISKTVKFVKQTLEGEGSGHDWWHIHRVHQNAIHIAEKEHADVFITELGALLHDIADWKFHGGDEHAGSRKSKEWLESIHVDKEIIEKVCEIIDEVSFKGAYVPSKMKSKEGMIVQDADRLDAIGAIGVARAFMYGGYKQREMYNPKVKPELHSTFEEYKKKQGPTINHFYEKLLLLKDKMNTETAKKLAIERHQFMEEYVARFLKEWEGKA